MAAVFGGASMMTGFAAGPFGSEPPLGARRPTAQQHGRRSFRFGLEAVYSRSAFVIVHRDEVTILGDEEQEAEPLMLERNPAEPTSVA